MRQDDEYGVHDHENGEELGRGQATGAVVVDVVGVVAGVYQAHDVASSNVLAEGVDGRQGDDGVDHVEKDAVPEELPELTILPPFQLLWVLQRQSHGYTRTYAPRPAGRKPRGGGAEQ